MTQEQIEIFREEFASIVYWKGMVKSQASHIGRLESWSKGGSHEKAILRNIKLLAEYRTKLKEKLRGKSYDEWTAFSKNLSVMNSKFKRSVNDATKNKWKAEIENAQWEVLQLITN